MKTKIEWSTTEYVHYQKSNDWFWAVGLVSLIGIILAIIFKNYLFAILIFLGCFLVFVYALKSPDELKIEVNEKGIRINNFIYPYKNINHFWIGHSEDKPNLFIQTERFFLPIIAIHLEDLSIEKIELIKQLLIENGSIEKELSEPISQRIMEKLGF